MDWITRKVTRWFFNKWYKVKPPESVKYWQWGDAAKAKVTKAPEGHFQMEIQGEKYPYPGFPRGHVLTGPLASLKHKIKNAVFNNVFAEIAKMADEMKADMVPEERMVPAVKELHRVLLELENAEVVDDMKGRIALIRKVICFFLQEDDAYRFRYQWVVEKLDMKKTKLSDADKYYFRGKYFKVDHDHFDY